ncbi:MAG: L-2-hydroxyglutarate oxidase [Gammaproteobacteria bacterium]
MYDYTVIGAGIVGLATALRLRQRYPDASIAVIEKEQLPAAHQSGHNSGVIHAGVYYEPGSAKAVLCRAGLAATLAFCRANDIPFEQCGKLVVATNSLEHERLRALHERAASNGVACELLDRSALAAIEPHVRGVAALRVRETGIVDYAAVARAMAARLSRDGVDLHFKAHVTAIDETGHGIELATSTGTVATAHLIACAGLQSDRIATLAGIGGGFAIVPFRGDFYRLPASRADLVRHLVYPVPDPALPFLGVHLTRTIDGGMIVGPSAMLAFDRETYAKFAFSWRDVKALARTPGLARLLLQFRGAGITECLHAVSRRAYLRAVRKYCPDLTLADLSGHSCGIRAQAVSPDGRLMHDFLIRRTPRSVHVCNAPSPAATAALPIADRIVDELAGPPG